jgi:hypothetical protein
MNLPIVNSLPYPAILTKIDVHENYPTQLNSPTIFSIKKLIYFKTSYIKLNHVYHKMHLQLFNFTTDTYTFQLYNELNHIFTKTCT